MKKVLMALLIIAIILVGGLVVIGSQAGGIIKSAVNDFGPDVTGTDVTVDSVSVSFLDGSASLSDFTLANPEGFKSDHAFKVGEISVKLDVMSVFNDIIHIKEIRIEGADLIYDIGTKGNNMGKIQKNVDAYSKKLGVEIDENAPPKLFIVDDIYINGTKVKLASDLLGGKGAGLKLGDIHLNNISNNGKGATAGEIASKIFGSINQGLGKVLNKDLLDQGLKKLKGIFK